MEMSATQKVGQEIKKVRYRIGLTQKELGKLIGKSESQIGAYENASASITLDVLFKIAEVTKTKPEELITGPTFCVALISIFSFSHHLKIISKFLLPLCCFYDSE